MTDDPTVRTGLDKSEKYRLNTLGLDPLVNDTGDAQCAKCGSTDGYLGTSGAYFCCRACNDGQPVYWTPDHQHPGDWCVAILASPHGRTSEVLQTIAFERTKRAEAEAEVERLRSLLSSRTPPEREQWQPMETAPKDESWLMLTDGRLPYVGRWFKWEGINARNGFWQSHSVEVGPTHWMPLPHPPPSGAQER